MVKISRFEATRASQQYINQFITKAYSNYSKKEIINEQRNNPLSFLNILKNNEKNESFKHVQLNLENFKKKSIIIKEKKSNIYIYEQIKNNISYCGIICGVSLKEYEEKKIKIHEKTLKKRELVFAKYLSEAKLYAEPVLITYKGHDLSNLIQESQIDQNLIYSFTDKFKTKHIIWKTNKIKSEALIKQFSRINNLYIADGHHRMSSSFINNANNNKCLAYIVPHSQLTTLPFHRVVEHNLNPKNLIKKINQHNEIKIADSPLINTEKVHMYLNENWYIINFKKTISNQDVVKNLIISKLSNNILKPIFNIQDERNNKDIKFIQGDGNISSLTKNITKNQVLFYLPIIKIKTIMKVADNNKTLPPKSTFIIPKIPSGLIMMEL